MTEICDPGCLIPDGEKSFHCDVIGRKMYRRHAELCYTDERYRELFETGTPVARSSRSGCGKRGLGDGVSKALSLLGITEDRVTAWLGRPCGCSERRERLNRLGRWAARAATGAYIDAGDDIEDILNE